VIAAGVSNVDDVIYSSRCVADVTEPRETFVFRHSRMLLSQRSAFRRLETKVSKAGALSLVEMCFRASSERTNKE